MARGKGDNVDAETVTGFGREWSRFRQGAELPEAELQAMFEAYFRIFPWRALPAGSVGIDIGCGSGRWAALVSERVGHLHLADPSALALEVARGNLKERRNVSFHEASVAQLPVADGSLDFAYSLGVLHHVPDTEGAIASVARKLKSGAPFLIYLYYAFDNRPAWFRALWRLSDLARRVISRLPPRLQYGLASVIAALVYWPLARMAALCERFGRAVDGWLLAYYRNRSIYVMRTDAYDRFCTRLEQRFTRAEIKSMLVEAGFRDVEFSDQAPYWCAVARKA